MQNDTEIKALYVELVENGFIITIDTELGENKKVFTSSRQLIHFIKELLKNDS